MAINLANICALLACAGLLIFWLTIGRRRLLGFYYTCTGWAAIVACVRSDHSLAQMLGILLGVALVSALLLVGWVTLKARRLARRRQVVYVPGQPALRKVK